MDEKLEFEETEIAGLVVGYGNLLKAFHENDFKRCEFLIKLALAMIGPIRYEVAINNINKQKEEINKGL